MVQGRMQLSRHEKQLAKSVWQECQTDMTAAKMERKRILDEMHATGATVNMREGMRPDRYSETAAILRQAAALAENSAVQQEIVLHSIRRFSLQVSKLGS